MDMKHISIQDLKAGLSGAVPAEAGATLVITRHNTPVARLVPADPREVHRGKSVAGPLRPAVRRSTGGRYLIVLGEDRGNR
jgi:prevent-host-death family protein